MQILILEDMPDTQCWLRDACVLAYPDASITLASSIAEATACLDARQPEIALVDLELPDGKGNTFIPTLLDRHPLCLCIVVTIYADENHLLPSLTAGAKGYILKDQSRRRIADMLQQAVAGELPLSPAIATLVLNHFSGANNPVEESPLTRRESDVLALIASGSSSPEVADRLNISKYTVEDHLKHVYQKLNISSRAEAALAAKRLGLI
ncbi:MAG: response regulator transcription factor [Pseudomonadales bacterium]|nr:response regulator transcription factor [Pseudomonadales bacterium]MCP5356960.1 response regulator transcription factor [Pseudomonadales bacterium]